MELVQRVAARFLRAVRLNDRMEAELRHIIERGGRGAAGEGTLKALEKRGLLKLTWDRGGRAPGGYRYQKSQVDSATPTPAALELAQERGWSINRFWL